MLNADIFSSRFIYLFIMGQFLIFFLLLLLLSGTTFALINSRQLTECDETINDRTVIIENLNNWSSRQLALSIEAIEAEWAWSNNLTYVNQRVKAEKSVALTDFRKKVWRVVSCFDCNGVCTEAEKRRLDTYRNIGASALSANAFKEYSYIQSTMQNIYSTAKVCRPNNNLQCLSLDPDLSNIMARSTDYCELLWAWQNWRDKTGRPIRPYFIYYVHMLNEAAVLHGMKDAKQMWTKPYTSDDSNFFQEVERAWQIVRPLYEHLHSYARRKLMVQYGTQRFPATGHIPAHLLGNMWSQDWTNLYELLRPDKTVEPINVTSLLLRNGYDVRKMVEVADDFFMSIGMDPFTDHFWDKSVLTRPPGLLTGSEMICHAAAWDFLRTDDVRLKMCAKVDQTYFNTIHHETGHIQYFQHYQHQPVEFRDGANPGFHEAIGDLISLSIMTPTHLKAINLLPLNFQESEGLYLNSLMKTALEKIAFLPFGYLLDKYRWLVFEKKIPAENLNAAWWQMSCDIQGVSPPVQRTEEDFDPGAKFHVAGSIPYIRYFISQILQYQIHVALCKDMGVRKDFHKCDIYRNATATRRLRDAMKLGSSKPYPQILFVLTGTAELDASGLMEYYDPLLKWLAQQNRGYRTGWHGDCMASTKPNKCQIGVNGAVGVISRTWSSLLVLFLFTVFIR